MVLPAASSSVDPAPGWQKNSVLAGDGVRLCWREHHDPTVPAARPALLCLPGLTRNGADFAHLAQSLGQDWRIIAPDLRGRGDSGWARDPLTYVSLAYLRDLLLVLDAAGAQRFVVIGSSLGGLLALRLAAAHRARVAGVVLGDIGPAIEPAGLARLRANVGRSGNWPTWVHAARDMGARNAGIHPDWGLHDWLGFAKRLCRLGPQGRIVFDYDPRIAEPFRLPHSDAGANAVGGAVGGAVAGPSAVTDAGADNWAAFDGLAGLPVLGLRGELSDVLSAAVHAEMQCRLPGMTAITVPGVGHAPTLAEPAAAAALALFLDQIARGER